MARSLNPSHPLFSSLNYLIGVEDDGVTIKDFVTPSRAFTLRNPSSTNDPVIGTGPLGVHFRTGGGYADPGGWTLAPSITPAPGAQTVIVIVNAVHGLSTDSNSVARESFFIGNTGGMNGTAGALQVCADASGNVIAHNVDAGGSNYAAASSTAMVTATARMMAATRSNSATRTLRVYIDGTFSATNASAGDNTAASRALDAIGGQQPGQVGTMDASIVYLVGLNKECSEAELDDLLASLGPGNAFGLFQTPAGPIITGPTTFNLAENDTTSGPLFSTDIAPGSGYPTKTGADQALFNLVSVGANQWRFVKIAGGNFEGPDDAGANRVYDVTFNASATVSRACAITLTNVAEPPGAPTIGTATAGDATVTIAGTAPAANGGPSVSSYLATLSPGGLTKTSATLPITLTGADGVVNGTAYTGTLRAINSEGTGPASAASNSVTPSSAPAPVRTVRTLPFSRNPGNGARPVSLPNNSVAVLTDAAGLAPIVNQAGLAMGSDGRVQLDSSSLPASGTSVVVVTREADGKLGVERYQVQ